MWSVLCNWLRAEMNRDALVLHILICFWQKVSPYGGSGARSSCVTLHDDRHGILSSRLMALLHFKFKEKKINDIKTTTLVGRESTTGCSSRALWATEKLH